MDKTMLYCGKFKYEVTPDAKKVLDGLIYWSFEQTLAREAGDTFAEKQAMDAINVSFSECDRLQIPNWVVNGAKAFGESHDMRGTYLSDFYEKSAYAKPPKKQMER